jgi:hypothetical protein
LSTVQWDLFPLHAMNPGLSRAITLASFIKTKGDQIHEETYIAQPCVSCCHGLVCLCRGDIETNALNIVHMPGNLSPFDLWRRDACSLQQWTMRVSVRPGSLEPGLLEPKPY